MYEAVWSIIVRAIRTVVAVKLGKTSVSLDEVEEIYESGKYPEINAEIDYILEGKKS